MTKKLIIENDKILIVPKDEHYFYWYNILPHELSHSIWVTKDEFFDLIQGIKKFNIDLDSVVEDTEIVDNKFETSIVYLKQLFSKYHSSHEEPYKYINDGKETNNYIGLELEMTAPVQIGDSFLLNSYQYLSMHKEYNKTFFVENDSSLHCGFEIITQPHSFNAFETFLNKSLSTMLNKLIEFGATNSQDRSAIHFHISKEFFGYDCNHPQNDNWLVPVANLYTLFAENTQWLYKLSKYNYPSNMNIKLHTWDEYYSYLSLLNAKLIETGYNSSLQLKARKQYLNITNLNTVEFRIFHATTNIEEIQMCYKVVKYLCEQSLIIERDKAHNIDDWFLNAPEDIKAFVHERIKGE